MDGKTHYAIVALEVWRRIGDLSWVVVVSLGAGFRAAYGSDRGQAADLMAHIERGYLPASFFDEHASASSIRAAAAYKRPVTQDMNLEAGARRWATRMIVQAVGGDKKADRLYGGALTLNLATTDDGFHSRDPDDNSTAPSTVQKTFDENDFRARRAAKAEARRYAAVIERASADRESRGKTTIRAYHRHGMRLAHVDVAGLTADGAIVANGRIITDYPSYAIIEAENAPELHSQPIFWFYRPAADVSIPVGASTRTEAPASS